jgi:hypothetical protein
VKQAKATVQPELTQPGSAWTELTWPVFAFDDCDTGTRHLSMQFDPMLSDRVTILMEGMGGESLSATIALVDLQRSLRIARATLETPNAHDR